MTKTNSGDGSIRYYCTAGNGMERFLIDEVKKKLSAEDVSVFICLLLFRIPP